MIVWLLSTSQVSSGVVNPILSFRSKISSGTMPRIAWRNMCFVIPSSEMRYCSGRDNKNSTKGMVRKGTRLSIEKAIELRSACLK